MGEGSTRPWPWLASGRRAFSWRDARRCTDAHTLLRPHGSTPPSRGRWHSTRPHPGPPCSLPCRRPCQRPARDLPATSLALHHPHLVMYTLAPSHRNTHALADTHRSRIHRHTLWTERTIIFPHSALYPYRSPLPISPDHSHPPIPRLVTCRRSFQSVFCPLGRVGMGQKYPNPISIPAWCKNRICCLLDASHTHTHSCIARRYIGLSQHHHLTHLHHQRQTVCFLLDPLRPSPPPLSSPTLYLIIPIRAYDDRPKAKLDFALLPPFIIAH